MTSKPITDGAKTDRRNQNMPEEDVAKAPIEPGMASREGVAITYPLGANLGREFPKNLKMRLSGASPPMRR